MKKQECAIVEDLLVLYEDDMLQPESKAMIEAHIKECESCRNLYREVGKEIRLKEAEQWKAEKSQDDAAVLVMKKVQSAIRKRWIRIVCIVMAVVIVGVCAANKVADRMTGHFGGVLEWVRLLPTEKIEVAKLYRLKTEIFTVP